jgi:hypothetical protein
MVIFRLLNVDRENAVKSINYNTEGDADKFKLEMVG